MIDILSIKQHFSINGNMGAIQLSLEQAGALPVILDPAHLSGGVNNAADKWPFNSIAMGQKKSEANPSNKTYNEIQEKGPSSFLGLILNAIF